MLVVGKLVGIVISSSMFGANLSIREYSSNIFNFKAFVDESTLEGVISYSDLIMYGFVATVFTLSVVKAVYLHSSHVKPVLVARLANKNLLALIQNSYEIYHSAFISLVFCWIGNIILLVNVFKGNTYIWIGIFCTITTIALTSILVQDVYKEIENIKRSPGKYQWI